MKTRPAPFKRGMITLRATGRAPDAEGRWLWRAEWYPSGARGKQCVRGLGRLTLEEISTREFMDASVSAADGTIGSLIEEWIVAVAQRAPPATGRPMILSLRRAGEVIGALPAWMLSDALLQSWYAHEEPSLPPTRGVGARRGMASFAEWVTTHRLAAPPLSGAMTCFECGAPAGHHHHVVPKSRGGKRTVSLCLSCHDLAHDASRTALRSEGAARRLRNGPGA